MAEAIEKASEARQPRIGRPPFRRHAVWVAVKPIRLSSKDILVPGDLASFPGVRSSALRRWYRRAAIGRPGHPWTDRMFTAYAVRNATESSPMEKIIGECQERAAKAATGHVPRVVTGDDLPEPEKKPRRKKAVKKQDDGD